VEQIPRATKDRSTAAGAGNARGGTAPKPALSVIVANCNNERYLAECLDSVLGQTFKYLEIVAYDDGSSDGSLAVLEEFRHRHSGTVRVIHDPVNRGVAHARHQAMLAARGEYVTTLDSDDFYVSRLKLEREISLVRDFQEREKKVVMAFSNVLLLKEPGRSSLWGTPSTIRQGLIGGFILGRGCFIPRDFVMKRDLYFQAGGYDTRLRIYEDWDLKIRLAMRHEFRFSGEVGTAYRRHGRGLSAAPFSEQREALRAVFAKNLHLAPAGEREAIRRSFEEWLASQGWSESQDGAPA